ncbi:hypothetical protein [Agromyces sp. CCNWLW203]|uniref:hypothetical protein n=1 Tax=Agromyces sp. CCNWLW203 TaxID=3112842 RepID=UPI002F964902
MGLGRISLLVSDDLRRLTEVARSLERELAARVRGETKAEAQPIFQESVRANVTTRLQTRVLSDTARVAVSDSNVTLKSATIGTLSSGVKTGDIAHLVEFGATPTKRVSQRSSKGNRYTRQLGRVVGPPRSRGYVFHPAVRESIPRLASLWMQTAYRTIAETFEKGAR